MCVVRGGESGGGIMMPTLRQWLVRVFLLTAAGWAVVVGLFLVALWATG